MEETVFSHSFSYTAAVTEDIFQRSVDAIFLLSIYVLNIAMLCELEDIIICLAPRVVYIVLGYHHPIVTNYLL